MQSVAYPVLSCPLKNLLNFPIYNSSEVPFVVQDSRTNYLKTENDSCPEEQESKSYPK